MCIVNSYVKIGGRYMVDLLITYIDLEVLITYLISANHYTINDQVTQEKTSYFT